MNTFASQSSVPLVVSVTSGKGGVGKTSFAVNVAAALAKRARRVLLIDGDLGLANVDVVLGLNVRSTIKEALEEGRDPAALLVNASPGFSVLPASSGVPEMAALTAAEQAFLTTALDRLLRGFDVVLVDTAAGIGDSVLWLNSWAQENIFVVSPDPTSMTDAYALIKILHTRYGRSRFHLLINNARTKSEGEGVFRNMALVLEKFLKIKPMPFGIIPYDKCVAQAIREQRPFLLSQPESRASRAVCNAAEQILRMPVSPRLSLPENQLTLNNQA